MGIVERLRKIDFTFWYSPVGPDEKFKPMEIGKLSHEAADEIEFLRKERDRLREALQKIYDDDSPEYIPEIMIKHLYSHYTIARDALNGEDE